ncbi:glycosyltransferase [Parahaliea sp. F7430]|uniref:Glycosyltransferase n=1 Tax=Sediminihaliea albiluteola TaxID=2758564 RepID=A0A7W2TUQ9_9GAMM|nr:glycosyltransferase [Sediminihaliea albiluteola]MBA6412292.1 glycosyltransferase [Sediminihaliea albiluteola]
MRSIIVTLTTTSKRLSLCRATIFSLVTQEVSPTKVVLNISEEPYLRDDGINYSDSELLSILTKGFDSYHKEMVEIRRVRNTGPYRKLMPTLKNAYGSDIIVTADDDILYGSNWLGKLLEDFDPTKKVIHAARVRGQKKNSLNMLTGYVFWPIVTKKKLMDGDWIVTYGGGAVLCRNWFSHELIDNFDYLKVAPTADDLWYSKICKLSALKVLVVPDALEEINFIHHNDGLGNYNWPIVKGVLARLKYHILDKPLNYYKLVRIGNDIAYDSIENYFLNKD